MNNISLRSIRQKKALTQEEASNLLKISLRSYKTYENDIDKRNTFKYDYLCELLEKVNCVDETHGVLSLDEIKFKVNNIFKKYNINFCYLFGSYSKGKATGTSDIDLLIDTDITGLDFYGLVEELRETLNKKIDLLKINQLINNEELLRNILKHGIKIYG